MQGTGKIFVSLLFFILFSFNVFSVGDITNINLNENIGLDVRVITYNNLQLDSGGQLAVHVTNRSNGLILTNISTACELDIYNSQGVQLLTQNLDYDSQNEVWNYTGASNLLNEQGEYNFFVNCNTSSVGGFYLGQFQVTESGFSAKYEQMLIIGMLILASLLIYLAYRFVNLDMAFSSGMLFSIVGVYMFRHGYLGIQNFISESLALIVIGIGITILWKTAVEYMNEASR